MSYILEAIKKADQKRKLGSVPDVHSEHAPVFITEKRAMWPYWIAVALFINAGLIGWWLMPSGEDQAPVQVAEVSSTDDRQIEQSGQNRVREEVKPQLTPKEAEQPIAVKEADGVDRVPEPVAELEEDAPELLREMAEENEPAPKPLPVQPAAEQAVSAVRSSEPQEPVLSSAEQTSEILSRQKETPPAPAATERVVRQVEDKEVSSEEGPNFSGTFKDRSEESLTNTEEEPDGLEAADTDAGREIEPLEGLDSTEQEPIIVSSLSKPASEQAVSEDDLVDEYKGKLERESEEKELEKIPFYYQLPDSTRKTLPEIHISFHMFAKRPSARIVSINGKILREGQDLDSKIKLEKITPSGVVMLADSWRFKVNID